MSYARLRVSSTLGHLASIANISGILDRPVIGGAEAAPSFGRLCRARTAEGATAFLKIVIASEAKQSIEHQERKLDCFVASLLAMTT